MSEDKHFNANRIFVLLFLATALEVAWGVLLGPNYVDVPKWALWGGLLIFAGYKGLLIAVYFMHLKFEGWVIWSLMVPTPFLMFVLFGYVLPDIANQGPKNNLVHPVGAMVDADSGKVRNDMWWTLEGGSHAGEEHADEEHEGEGEEH